MDLSVRIERWPLANAFTISRGSKTEAVVVVVELADGGASRPRRSAFLMPAMARSPEGVVAAIEAMRPALARGLDRAALQERDAGRRGAQRARLRLLGSRGQAQRAPRLCVAGIAPPQPLITAYTISLAARRGHGGSGGARGGRGRSSR